MEASTSIYSWRGCKTWWKELIQADEPEQLSAVPPHGYWGVRTFQLGNVFAVMSQHYFSHCMRVNVVKLFIRGRVWLEFNVSWRNVVVAVGRVACQICWKPLIATISGINKHVYAHFPVLEPWLWFRRWRWAIDEERAVVEEEDKEEEKKRNVQIFKC